VQASFTYNEQQPPATGRIPTTLVIGVPLANKPQSVAGMWMGVRGSTVIIDSDHRLGKAAAADPTRSMLARWRPRAPFPDRRVRFDAASAAPEG
jgi:hypothetical protein